MLPKWDDRRIFLWQFCTFMQKQGLDYILAALQISERPGMEKITKLLHAQRENVRL